ncbi:ER membrane protein complex subunit 6 [Galendromus occidentalis]|uniref:ER membrane protein complex subunit 6 n=1 Tax=Galendromus occidentalis TaxID=34638 RepID=A0AAJ6QVQ7_9ACAR|nr:ER membrane protein complex subunit 6 [Galendromus occidentalis]
MIRNVSQESMRKPREAEYIALNETALRHNTSVLSFTRTAVSALSGVSAGILGLTSFCGFAFYFFTALILWCMLVFRNYKTWPKYLKSRRTFLTHSLLEGLFTYILFWTFSYGMVHVY